MKNILLLAFVFSIAVSTRTMAAEGDLIVNGKIGVGKTNPQYSVDVSGNARIGHYLMLPADSGYEWWTGCFTETEGPWQLTHRRISDSTWTNAITIFPDGKMGLGVTAPAYPLHMASGARVTTGGVWTNASSRDYKKTLKLLALRPHLIPL